MISFQQVRKFFLNIGLALFMATSIAFGFGTASSWANSQITPLIQAPQPQIATMNPVEAFTKNVKGTVQEAIGNMTGETQDQTIGEAKQFKAETLEGMDNSIQNPNYKPSEKIKQAEKEDREAIEDIETGVRDTFNWESPTK